VKEDLRKEMMIMWIIGVRLFVANLKDASAYNTKIGHSKALIQAAIASKRTDLMTVIFSG
jgi:hypothetical protein